MIASLLSIPLALFSVSSVSAAPDLTAANNLTDLEGTWSSNTAVSTGNDICIPEELKFTYPNNTGISYSFTNTGFFEEVQYQYTSNGSNPNCITAYIYWQHGTYSLNDNGSMSLYPFGSDGRIQVQDPCAATSNVITYYDEQVLFTDWGIIVEPNSGRYELNLNKYDESKMAKMYLTHKPPNMLPTQYLTGDNATILDDDTSSTRKRSVSEVLDLVKRGSLPPTPNHAKKMAKRSGALPKMMSTGQMWGMAGFAGAAFVGMMALF